MIEALFVKGEVKILVYKGEQLISKIEESNLVVTLGKTNISKLLGGDAGGLPISKISVGTSNAPALVTDSALTGSFSKDISSISYPDSQSVMFHFEIDNSEANGTTIREFGLLNTNDVLCARKVRDTEIEKTNAIRLVGTWKLTIN